MRPPPTPIRSEHFHVLLVEPDDHQAAALAAYLERSRLRVTRAADGFAGLAEALRAHHDVVVLDLKLPGLPGLELCKRVRAWVRVPVLALSATGGEADRELALEGGADDFMPKSASPSELVMRLRALVRETR